MLTPSGKPAGNIDKIMLLSRWARHLHENGHSMIYAGMGKPTLATNESAASAALRYWSEIQFSSQNAHHFYRNNENNPETRNSLAKMGGVIDYGDPQGDFDARQTMAKALTKWYQGKINILPQDILFTVGGAGAIHTTLKFINKDSSNGRIITPFPHYSLYANSVENTFLHPINVMKQPGYRLTAKALEESIQSALSKVKVDGRKVSAFLFNDPNNPLGTIVSEKEWTEIAEILRQYPGIPIILDEAYAEMRLDGKHYKSLLEVAPDLQDRIILFRSATKALSAAGQRMAIIFTKNPNWMEKLIANNVNTCGHAARIEQKVFAAALENFSKADREELAAFYGPQVQLANQRLANMGASLPDPQYKVEGTFYTLADMSDLFGLELPAEAEKALGKKGIVETGEDVTYYLLFKGVMLAPLCYFGANPKNGFMRITCSGGDAEINALCDVLEKILSEARLIKVKDIQKQVRSCLEILDALDTKSATAIREKYQTQLNSNSPRSNGVDLKKLLESLKSCLEETHHSLMGAKHKLSMLRRGFDEGRYAKRVQCLYRKHSAKSHLTKLKQEQAIQWEKWVKSTYQHLPPLCDALLKFSPLQRYEFKPWREYLKESAIVAPSLKT